MHKHWFRLGFAVVALSAAACGSQGPEGEEPNTDDAEVEVAAEAPTAPFAKGKHHKAGPDRLIRAALDELELSDAQRVTIQGLLAVEPARPEGMKELMTALGAGVRANAIDEAALGVKIASMSQGGAAQRAKHAESLQKLHQTLTPAQRSQLVEKLQAKMQEKQGKLAQMREHFEGEDAPHGRSDKADRPGKSGRSGKFRGGPLGQVMKDLQLSDEQRDAVKKAVEGAVTPPDRDQMKAKFEAMHASKKAMLDAFATDSFDAAKLLPEHDGKGRDHLTQLVSMTRAVLPILDATQRDKLAGMLEAGDFGKRGKHGKDGKRGKHGKRGNHPAGPAAAESE